MVQSLQLGGDASRRPAMSRINRLPVAIALFRGQYQVPWGQVFAASIVATAPLAVLILVAQRRIVQGLTAGGVKG